ncbi:hypothetical protein EMPS_06429 [Entomortierella parvispora]|uniref:FAD-binding domain-containing protein n=1 Tax=Entomortierella parvispora TaxID=205924 RepID=A0A9P3HCJ7_9FUNG|nr:hypothetical protein EMPS_06429 [Entomortierella parvispora]
MTSLSTENRDLPSVIIVGAGLGGLLLAILLDRIGIEYTVLERSAVFRSLGSAMAMGPHLLPVFEQLGMLKELQDISLECHTMLQFDEHLTAMGEVLMKGQKELTGYDNIIFLRPDFHRLLLSKISSERIINNKRVLKIEEPEDAPDKVRVTCADNSVYEADMVIGADGTYSAVRQNMYRLLEESGKLPKPDKEPMGIGYTCMVGITGPVDPEKYPELKDDFTHFRSVVGGVRHNWGAISQKGNRFSWSANIQFASQAEAQRQQFMNSEWGPESNKEMIKEFHSRPNPFGGTMGDFIDATPPELISKVFLEHKMFKTWYHGRSVLIGDACHKMLPSAGQGAVNAMQDAVILANCFYDLKDKSAKSITEAFESFYSQRYERAKDAYNLSQMVSKIMLGQSWSDRLMRTVLLKYLPHSVQQRQYEKAALYRPQIMFLPLTKNKGSVAPLPQKPCQSHEDYHEDDHEDDHEDHYEDDHEDHYGHDYEEVDRGYHDD